MYILEDFFFRGGMYILPVGVLGLSQHGLLAPLRDIPCIMPGVTTSFSGCGTRKYTFFKLNHHKIQNYKVIYNLVSVIQCFNNNSFSSDYFPSPLSPVSLPPPACLHGKFFIPSFSFHLLQTENRDFLSHLNKSWRLAKCEVSEPNLTFY